MTSPARAPVALSLALAGALLAAAPAHGQEAPYEPTGEVRLVGGGFGGGASFDTDRVVGPLVNLTRRDDGSWAGDLRGGDLDLQPNGRGDGLQAPNVTLRFSSKDGKTRVEGLFYGTRVRFDLDGKKLSGRFGGCSMTLARRGPPLYHGEIGCVSQGARLPRTDRVTLELIGEAAAETAPLPQLALALLAVLPG
jgi:hypothetical protein